MIEIFCGAIHLTSFLHLHIIFLLFFLTFCRFILPQFLNNVYLLPFPYLFRSHVGCMILCLSYPCFSIATSMHWCKIPSNGFSTLIGHKQSFWDVNSGFWLKLLFVSFTISAFLLVCCFVSSHFESSRDPS